MDAARGFRGLSSGCERCCATVSEVCEIRPVGTAAGMMLRVCVFSLSGASTVLGFEMCTGILPCDNNTPTLHQTVFTRDHL